MSNPLISVVVPVYQAEAYLEETLRCILGQTYTDFELLLVDDGASDRSPEICDTYAAKDTRVRVFHRTNAGASEARNFGIREARGKYLAFVDADDLVDADFLEQLIACFEEPEVDLALCGFDKFYHDDVTDKLDYLLGWEEKKVLVSNRELVQLFTVPSTSLSGVSIWAKLYRLCLIREFQIVFPKDISYEEDCCFNVQYYRHVRKAVTIRKNLYHYRQQLESLSKTYRASVIGDLVHGYQERKCLLRELKMPETAQKKVDAIFLIVIFSQFKKIVKSSLSASERRREYCRILSFQETRDVVANCALSKYRVARYLTLASRVRSYLLIDLLLLEWKRREEKHQA